MCKFLSGIPCTVTGKVYPLVTLKNQTWLITWFYEGNEWNWTPQDLPTLLYQQGKATDNIHVSSRQASEKSKDHKIFKCHKRPFGSNSWLYEFSIIFRGCHPSQKGRHCQFTPSKKIGPHYFGFSRTLSKLLPERRLDPPKHQGN